MRSRYGGARYKVEVLCTNVLALRRASYGFNPIINLCSGTFPASTASQWSSVPHTRCQLRCVRSYMGAYARSSLRVKESLISTFAGSAVLALCPMCSDRNAAVRWTYRKGRYDYIQLSYNCTHPNGTNAYGPVSRIVYVYTIVISDNIL